MGACLGAAAFGIGALTALIVIFPLMLPPKHDLRGAYQVRLNSAGYGARHGFGPIPRRPWFRDMTVHVNRHPDGGKLLIVTRSGRWEHALSLVLDADWPTIRELAHQIGDWIEAAPKASDHRDSEGEPVVSIERVAGDPDD